MANPIFKNCTVNAWTKVATAVTAGMIKVADFSPSAYLETYRMTGEAAPTTEDEGIAMVETEPLIISATAAIDVYLYAKGAAGRVRCDL